MTGTVHNAGEAAAGQPRIGCLRRRPGHCLARAPQEPVGCWAVVIVVALAAALLIGLRGAGIFGADPVNGPTLVPDRVLVNKLSYDLHPVHDGDVVVFRRPPSDHSTVGDLIKRVIAGPGQWLRVTGCKVYVDDRLQSQPYLPKGWQDPSSEYCTLWDLPGMLNLPTPTRCPPGITSSWATTALTPKTHVMGALPGATSSAGLLFDWPVSRIGSL